MRLSKLMALTILLAGASVLFARPVKVWTEDELWKEADVVVIGSVVATKDGGRKPPSDTDPRDWVEVETKFKVVRKLKGEVEGDRIGITHFRYHDANSEVTVPDGPSFVRFNADKKHTYLIFLKRNAETARWEPLTGQYDPSGAFFHLTPYHISVEQ
jgi:hypothetical protein